MLNLMSNSVKYNKPNGTIDTYATEISDDGETALYEFRIVDSGIGMSREFIENELFKPFTQEENDARTQYRGIGLGMSIVKALIGKLAVRSRLRALLARERISHISFYSKLIRMLQNKASHRTVRGQKISKV